MYEDFYMNILKKVILLMVLCITTPQVSRALPESTDPRVIGMIAIGCTGVWYGGKMLYTLALGGVPCAGSFLPALAQKTFVAAMGATFITGGLGCILGSRHIVSAGENLMSSLLNKQKLIF